MTSPLDPGPPTDPPATDGHLLPADLWPDVVADAAHYASDPSEVDYREPEDLA